MLILIILPVAERSKAWVYNSSPAGVAGSNPAGAWMFVCCKCCVCLSGRGLCDELITRPEESNRLCSVIVCDVETSRMRKLKPASGLWKPVAVEEEDEKEGEEYS